MRGKCCASGVLSKQGECCPGGVGAATARNGECCADGVDACGVCGGRGKAVDVQGQCCEVRRLCCSPQDSQECTICATFVFFSSQMLR